jgi:hypothetical protein
MPAVFAGGGFGSSYATGCVGDGNGERRWLATKSRYQ